jgi:hypothetical protein
MHALKNPAVLQKNGCTKKASITVLRMPSNMYCFVMANHVNVAEVIPMYTKYVTFKVFRRNSR